MSMVRILFVFLMSFVSGFLVQAQDINSAYNVDTTKLINFAELSLDINNPIYSFGNRLDKTLYGLSVSYLRQRNVTRPDCFGVQFSYAHIGSITQNFFDFEDRTGTNLMSLRFLYRFYPDFYFWRIEPFIETSFGPQLVYTVTTTTSFIDDSASLNFEESDMGISYGVGLGFSTYISGQVFLLTKFSFNGGSSLTYFMPGDYIQGLPFENFYAETSSINYLNLQLGLSVSF